MKYLSILFLPLLAMNANARHSCTGTVTNVDVSGNNIHAQIEGIGTGNQICSLTQTQGEYSPEACKAVFSMLLSAKMSEKKIRLYFRNDSNTSCNKGSWQVLNNPDFGLYYVRLEG